MFSLFFFIKTSKHKYLHTKRIFYHHYHDVIMGPIASQITSLTIIYSTVYQTQIKENIKAPRHWRVCVCVCICLVHQVAHPSFGEQCLFTYPLIVLLLLCYFLPLLLWFLGHLPWSILHIHHILFFPWLFCIRLKHAFVFHLPLDIGGMFCFRTCLHNWLLLVASLFLPLLYCYIVFLSFFLGTLLFFWVFFLPSCPASVLP